MKKRTICAMLVLIICLSVAVTAMAATRQADGTCSLTNTGRNVVFDGESSSSQIEDEIGVTVVLWEKRGTVWYQIARASKSLMNTDYVYVSGTKTVEGGHYYKVTGTHTSEKNGVSHSGLSKVPPRLCKPKLSDRIKGNGGRNNGKEGKEPHAAAD